MVPANCFNKDGYIFQTYMKDGKCVSGYLWTGPVAEKLYLVFACLGFSVYYALPCACFFFLYGMVAIKMHRRKNSSNFESNR